MSSFIVMLTYSNKTKYSKLLQYWAERDIRETWARMMKIESSRQTWTGQMDKWMNEQTDIVTPWAPDGAKKDLSWALVSLPLGQSLLNLLNQS